MRLTPAGSKVGLHRWVVGQCAQELEVLVLLGQAQMDWGSHLSTVLTALGTIEPAAPTTRIMLACVFC